MWIGIWRVDIVNGKARDCLQKKNGRRLHGGQMAGFIHGGMKRIRGMRIQNPSPRLSPQGGGLGGGALWRQAFLQRMSALTVFMIWVAIWLNGHPLYIVHIREVQWQKERHLRESSML